MEVEKTCWPLAELATKWGCTEDDLLWLGIRGKLQLSIWCQHSFVTRHFCGEEFVKVESPPKAEFYIGWLPVDQNSIFYFTQGYSEENHLFSFSFEDKKMWAVATTLEEIPSDKPDVTNYKTDYIPHVPVVVTRNDLKVLPDEVERYERENRSTLSDQKPKNIIPDYLNPEHTCYAPKLAAAVEAWIAVVGGYGNRYNSPKARLGEWIKKHAHEERFNPSRKNCIQLCYAEGEKKDKLKTESLEQIPAVANWKSGGSNKTGG